MKAKKLAISIFQDPNFEHDEAENLKVRAKLMLEIEKQLKHKGVTQEEAAEILGVSQPRISNLMKGKIGLFSIDTLISMLDQLGMKIQIKVDKTRAA